MDTAGVITATTTSSSDIIVNVESNLLELPAEVRQIVHRELFQEANVEIRIYRNQLRLCDNKITSILRVNRLLRAEALPIAHGTVLFHGKAKAFQRLHTLAKGYGGLVDSSKLAKVRMNWNRWNWTECDPFPWIAGWIEQSRMLQEINYEIRSPLPPRAGRNIPSTNQLYDSETLRQSELGNLMGSGYTTCLWSLTRDVELLHAKVCSSRSTRPKIVIEAEMFMSDPDDWSLRVHVCEKRLEIKLKDKWFTLPQKRWGQL
ncbi:uncharacterized protein AB675_1382 [Cyphellophora attinorum]|uniref:Uncharacterized protein n=1 Tax=Cyphellophora attinorum TaxID=1664694 RepID=A0A0N1H207_9EURO|nr:uncharacterized protein AB675_1382 [Phialophora attinorum]KPI35095.1 hypothetical protein AB675_1382 [Phialophora attinorum]